MVIPFDKMPKLFWIFIPISCLCAFLFFSVYSSRSVQGYPDSFSIDSRGTLYIGYKYAINVVENERVVTKIPVNCTKGCYLYVTQDDMLIVANGMSLDSIDLSQRELGSTELPKMETSYASDYLSYEQIQDGAKEGFYGDAFYRYETNVLRYRIVRYIDGQVDVIYEMPLGDYMWLLAGVACILGFMVCLAITLKQAHQIYAGMEREKHAA